jgi:ribulose-phosphate 3-epimerase
MIIPAILENSLDEIERKITQIDGLAPLIQIDIADGGKVDDQTCLDLGEILKIETKSQLEIHLMVENPLAYLKVLEALPKELRKNVIKVSTQIEMKDCPLKKLGDWLSECKKLGLEKGLSLDPETPIKIIRPYINQLDFIQLLAVTPGKQGGIFKPEIIKKIKEAKQAFQNLPLQVDGGIKENNLATVLQAGADNVVIGSAILEENSPKEAYKNFEKIEKEWKTK